MKTAIRSFFFCSVFLFANCTAPVKPEIAIIPQPSQVDFSQGWYEITPSTAITLAADQPALQVLAAHLADVLFPGTPERMPIQEYHADEKPASGIVLQLVDTSTLGDEGYELSIRPQVILLYANKPAGIFYAMQSLRQLLPSQPAVPAASNLSHLRVPCLTIKDNPAFKWRGLMLDCSRTFLNKAYLFRYIDLLAMHKMNVLHLHLTDDQGWRIEIKKHPRLTEIGSRFASRYAGEKNGYYSQQDIREIVHYAALRHVTIVPEIEMPGHATALLAVYPELSCSGRRQDIFPFFQGPAVTRDILCAGNDAVFDVMKDVLAEVMELFPSQYIHVGGDEAPKDRWQACPKCRQRIKEEGLHNEDELQSYFMRRIGDFVRSKGRTLIGWDEILEGGLAPNAAVMSWRGTKGGYEAAILNHEVVMSPTTHCYFDYDVRQISLDKTYAFCPIPEGLPEEKTRFILGGQANMWTHIARTDSTIDQQIFPRLLALAEALWSKPEQKRFKDFYHRYKSYEQRLHLLGVAVGPAAEPIILQPQMDSLAHRISCRLDVHLPDLRVYYTLNGDLPTRDSRMYKTPFVFEANTTLKAQAFIDEKPYGAMLEKAYTQHLATGRKVTFSSPLCRRYPGSHEYALTDGWSGSLNQRDGFWLGVETTDLQATVDLERVEQLGSIRMNFLSKSSARIFAPMEVLFSVSTDGRVFKTVYRIENEIRKSWKEDAIWTAQAEQLDVPARYVNILAKNVKTVPLWHPGAGAPAFILADELILTAAAVN